MILAAEAEVKTSGVVEDRAERATIVFGAERDAAVPTALFEEKRQMYATKKIVSCDPEVMGGELVFAGTHVELKTLVHYLKAGYSLDDFLSGFPTVGREQAETYLETTLKVAGELARSSR